MVRFDFDHIPEYLKIELEDRDFVPEINSTFIAILFDKAYIIGKTQKIESVFINGSEHFSAIIKTTTLIISNKSYKPREIPIIPL